MDKIKNILVGIDFSACSAAALLQAVRIAEWHRAKVAAVHVVRMPMYTATDGLFLPVEMPPIDLLVDAAKGRWSNWVPACDSGRDVAFDTVVGIPRMELLDRVRGGAVDLLVLGAHGDHVKHGVGSTASACVQHAGTKVLVVREGETQPFRSVVACIDFSDTSRLALEQAVRVAAQDGARLHVLHVYDDPWREIQARPGVSAHLPQLGKAYTKAVEDHLRSFCEPFSHEISALKGSFQVLQAASHGKGILEFIEHEGCDLAVLGTRAKWNLRDFLWGSTAERVVREAPCSVLTVKPPGFEQR